MQKTKDIKHEEYRHSLLQQPMSLKHCMDTNTKMEIVAPKKEISYKNGMQLTKKLTPENLGVLMKYMYAWTIVR